MPSSLWLFINRHLNDRSFLEYGTDISALRFKLFPRSGADSALIKCLVNLKFQNKTAVWGTQIPTLSWKRLLFSISLFLQLHAYRMSSNVWISRSASLSFFFSFFFIIPFYRFWALLPFCPVILCFLCFALARFHSNSLAAPLSEFVVLSIICICWSWSYRVAMNILSYIR